MSNLVDVPGVGEGMPVQQQSDGHHTGGHGHSHDHGNDNRHGHGHGHGHHSHAHKEGEDQWDGEAYVAKPGA